MWTTGAFLWRTKKCEKFCSTKVREKWSLYVPFIELGNKMLRPKGRFNFIIPNTWMSASFGKELKGYLLDSVKIEKIENISTLNVFGSDVGTYPVLLFTENSKLDDYNIQLLKYDGKNEFDLQEGKSSEILKSEIILDEDLIFLSNFESRNTILQIENIGGCFGKAYRQNCLGNIGFWIWKKENII